jgi:superfamily II RNA helicase
MQYRGLELDRFQAEAIEHLSQGSSVIVSAPTGTGKTIIADYIVDEALAKGSDVIYTAPIKALSNQKFRDYTRLFGEDRVGLVTGDLVIRREAPCRVMTTEILRNMLLSGGEDLSRLHAVIIDEIHFLDDRERGTVWEEVLIYLPANVQIVGLSATLSNLDEMADWIRSVRTPSGGPEAKVHVIVEHQRAVPLTYYFASIEGGLQLPPAFEETWRRQRGRAASEPKSRGRAGRGGRDHDRRAQRTRHTDIFKMIRHKNWTPYLYFVFSRKDTESYARELGRYAKDGLLEPDEADRMHDWLARAAGQLGPALDQDLRELYEKGIAFHHAGLHVQLKALVEELYENKLIKVLYCTSTFALGINMPARSVVFDGLKKFDGREVNPLTTRGFMQKAGRAGRRGLDDAGHVIIRMDVDDYEELKPVVERYRRGAYEPVRSSFNLSWNSVVCLLERHDEARIREIVNKSFLSWHLSSEINKQIARAEQLEGSDDPRVQKEARRLRRRADKGDDRVWQEFQRKVYYLRDIGYLGDDNRFLAGARILRHLQIAELPVVELVICGALESLDDATLFGVLCALTNELPRGTNRNFWPSKDDRKMAREIEQVVRSSIVTGGAEITGTPWTFEPDLIVLGRAWAEGRSLQEVLMMVSNTTDISGDLITGFRRAKDLAGQLRDVYADLPERRARIQELIRRVSRDEVEVVD